MPPSWPIRARGSASPLRQRAAAASLDLGLWFERPSELILSGASPGSDGPPLTVDVNLADTQRLLFTVFGAPRPLIAIVEQPDVASFRITSRGAAATPEIPVAMGQSGQSGSECQNGSNGSDGGPGGDGAPGKGGDIWIRLHCGQQFCSDTIALLPQIVVSEGGPGGWGGPGGRGGSGGWAGLCQHPHR